MKKFLINLVLGQVIDLAIAALKTLAMKSSSKVDDALVDTVAGEKENIIAEIKAAL